MKKNNKKLILLLFIMIFMLSGCTKILKDSDNNVVKYDSDTVCTICENKYLSLENDLSNYEVDSEEYIKLQDEIAKLKSDCEKKCESSKTTATGQNLTENILCKPTNSDVILIYEAYNVDVNSLSECSNFSIFNNYESLWISFFVKPLAWLLIKFGFLVNNYGLSLIIITILLRLLLMPFTKETAMQSEKMKLAQPEIDKLNKKYENKTDTESQTAKAQETMLIYNKYGIKPLSSCLFAFIQIPLLFAFIEAINRTPALFEGKFLGLELGLTPIQALKTGKWWYLIVVILIAIVTHFSLKMNKGANAPGNDTANQMELMNKIMLILIIYLSLSMSIAICIYWIVSSSFTIYQNIIVKKKVK